MAEPSGQLSENCSSIRNLGGKRQIMGVGLLRIGSLRHRHLGRWGVVAPIFAVACLAALLAKLGRDEAIASNSRAGGPSLALPASQLPYRVPPIAPKCFFSGSSEAAAVSGILKNPPHPAFDGRLAIHLLRAYGRQTPSRVGIPAASELVSALTGHTLPGRYTGERPLVETRYGVRYRTSGASAIDGNLRENHRDIFLATFAEQGLPLSTPLKVNSTTTLTIAALLNDSFATFDLRQSEIEWSAIAYALYASDRANWSDNGGNQTTFDQLAGALIDRELAKCSCAGAHVLMAMTYLSRIDAEAHLLSEAKRHALSERLANCVRIVLSQQRDDGSWSNPWTRGFDDQTDREFERLLVSGHILEWLEYLPAELQPPSGTYIRAVHWLIPRLNRIQHYPTFNSIGWTCPWTHAACALENLCADDAIFWG